ncbi:MAG: TolB family protein [Longimicrobiales bacterium]
MPKISALLTATLIATTACSEVSGPKETGIVFSGAVGVADTIGALIEQPITVQIRDAQGRPISGAPVEFRIWGPAWMYPTLEDAQAHRFWNRDAFTDSQGRASVYIRFRDQAAHGYVTARFGEDTDSVVFHVLPGAAAGIHPTPADTALLAGQDYSLIVYAADRAGNRRPEVLPNVMAVSADPDIADAQGSDIAALTPGRATVDVTAAGASAQVQLSVVPDATLASLGGSVPELGERPVLGFVAGPPVLMSTAATSAEPIPGDGESVCARWHPDGDRLLLDGLRIMTLQGSVTQISTSDAGLVAGCGEFSRDAEWIYFEGRLSTESASASQIWRIRTDGTALEQITHRGGTAARNPSPAPDGERLVYSVNDTAGRGLRKTNIVIHDIGTGVTDTIVRGYYGLEATWSPTGEWIAYTYTRAWPYYPSYRPSVFGKILRLIRPDGSEDRQPPVLGTVSWSPDGQWLTGKAFYPDLRIKLVNIATGETLPLNYATRPYSRPAWKP